jgi:hypothetical protein
MNFSKRFGLAGFALTHRTDANSNYAYLYTANIFDMSIYNKIFIDINLTLNKHDEAVFYLFILQPVISSKY